MTQNIDLISQLSWLQSSANWSHSCTPLQQSTLAAIERQLRNTTFLKAFEIFREARFAQYWPGADADYGKQDLLLP